MVQSLTRRQSMVLAALATQPGHAYAPVQVQKLFFLADENVSEEMGGKLFNFAPYNYGPFDAEVYHELEQIQAAGLLMIVGGSGGSRKYVLTAAGQALGQTQLSMLPAPVSAYFERAAAWVKGLSFAQLVGSIYKAYPGMRANSIFEG